MTYSGYLPLNDVVTVPFRPAASFDRADPKAHYWIKHGIVFFNDHPVEGADSNTFLCYLSEYAIDASHVYKFGRRDRTLTAKTFRCFSFAYHGDEHSVRTYSGGRIQEADVESFRALDRGYEPMPGGAVAFILRSTGYAADRNRVYWCDSGGKGMHVVKASAASFEAMTCTFGRDDRHVFSGRAAIPKANPKTWRHIDGPFSTDERLVFCLGRVVAGADPATFQVYTNSIGSQDYARDRSRYYAGSNEIPEEEFARGVS